MKEVCTHFKFGCAPPDGYPNPYGVPKDGSIPEMPPGGYGTDYWSLCLTCKQKSHTIMNRVVEVVTQTIDKESDVEPRWCCCDFGKNVLLEFSDEVGDQRGFYTWSLEFCMGEKHPNGTNPAILVGTFKNELTKVFNRRFPKNKRYYQTIIWRVLPEVDGFVDFESNDMQLRAYTRFMVIEGLPGDYFIRPKRQRSYKRFQGGVGDDVIKKGV